MKDKMSQNANANDTADHFVNKHRQIHRQIRSNSRVAQKRQCPAQHEHHQQHTVPIEIHAKSVGQRVKRQTGLCANHV